MMIDECRLSIEEEIEDRQGCYMIFPRTPGRGNFKGYNFNGLSFAGYLTARRRLKAGGSRMRDILKTGTGSTRQKGGNAKKPAERMFRTKSFIGTDINYHHLSAV